MKKSTLFHHTWKKYKWIMITLIGLIILTILGFFTPLPKLIGLIDYFSSAITLYTLTVAFFIWIMERKEEYKNSLPKVLDIVFKLKLKTGDHYLIVCTGAPLASMADARGYGQQIGRQITGNNNLDMKMINEFGQPYIYHADNRVVLRMRLDITLDYQDVNSAFEKITFAKDDIKKGSCLYREVNINENIIQNDLYLTQEHIKQKLNTIQNKDISNNTSKIIGNRLIQIDYHDRFQAKVLFVSASPSPNSKASPERNWKFTDGILTIDDQEIILNEQWETNPLLQSTNLMQPLRGIKKHITTLQRVYVLLSIESQSQKANEAIAYCTQKCFPDSSIEFIATGLNDNNKAIADQQKTVQTLMQEEINNRNIASDHIVLDITGGKKCASVALACAAINTRIGIQYVDTAPPYDTIQMELGFTHAK